MTVDAEQLEALTERIIGCAIEVHRWLGPGLLESVYRECLVVELHDRGLRFEKERQVALEYKGRPIRGLLKLDLLVEQQVIVELKAVDSLHRSSRPGDHVPETDSMPRGSPHELQFNQPSSRPKTPAASRAV